MSSSSVGALIARIPVQGILYNTYTTAKSMLTSTASEASSGFCSLPSNFFLRGGCVRITVHAGISNRVTGPDTFTINIMVGSVIAFTTGAINLTTTAHTTIPAVFTFYLTCQKEGAGTTAQLMGQCFAQGQMIAMAASLADGVANTGWAMAPNTAPTLGTGFDSTIAESLDFFVAQSVSNAGNGFQLAQYWVESLGNTAV
jgi:hypothetical protein